MADSLDDFFAKKDKKRGKDKGKAALSAGALVRELEEGARQTDYPSRKDVKTSTAIGMLGLDADDADWRDFEDIEKRDYTGLKVKEMSLQDQADEEQRRLAAEQSEQVAESTPWKIKDDTPSADLNSNAKQQVESAKSKTESANVSDSKATTSSNSTASEVKKTDNQPVEAGKGSATTTGESTIEKKDDTTSAKKSAYVPPSQRGLNLPPPPVYDASGVKVLEPMKLSKGPSTRRGTGAVPNIEDERAFPSLG